MGADADIRVGDRVRLLGLPDWLLNNLPESEQVEMRSFIGRTALLDEIDKYGYFWIGFGTTEEHGDEARYSGHSFCVPREFIEIVNPRKADPD